MENKILSMSALQNEKDWTAPLVKYLYNVFGIDRKRKFTEIDNDPGQDDVFPIMSIYSSEENVCEFYSETQLSLQEIKIGRKYVSTQWLKKKKTPNRQLNLEGVDDADLKDLFDLYDKTFFRCEFKKYYAFYNYIKFKISFSDNDATSAGECRRSAYDLKDECLTHQITINRQIHTNTFSEPNTHAYDNGGVLCHNSLECLQMTLEHEMIHLLGYVWENCHDPYDSVTMGHGPLFFKLQNHIFGQIVDFHQLHRSLTKSESDFFVKSAALKLPFYEEMKSRLNLGDKIMQKQNAVKFTVLAKMGDAVILKNEKNEKDTKEVGYVDLLLSKDYIVLPKLFDRIKYEGETFTVTETNNQSFKVKKADKAFKIPYASKKYKVSVCAHEAQKEREVIKQKFEVATIIKYKGKEYNIHQKKECMFVAQNDHLRHVYEFDYLDLRDISGKFYVTEY